MGRQCSVFGKSIDAVNKKNAWKDQKSSDDKEFDTSTVYIRNR